MRKFILNTYYDTKSFDSMAQLVEKTDEGNVTIFNDKFDLWEPKPKYTKEEQKQINTCNKILSDKGKPELTEEEIEFMLDPSGIKKRLEEVEKQSQILNHFREWQDLK